MQQSCLGNALLCTDDDEIMTVGLNEGLWSWGIRPPGLAHDDTKTVEVLKYRLEQHPRYDAVLCLQPTNPLRTPEDIDIAVELYREHGPDSVISVTPVVDYHPAHMCRVSGSRLSLWVDDARAWGPRQGLDRYYLRDGSIYITSARCIFESSMVGKRCRVLEIPTGRSIRIDSQYDLDKAQFMYERLLTNTPST